MRNHRKPLILVALAFILTVSVAATFQANGVFNNLFSTDGGSVATSETYTPPENWMPGDSTEKTVEVKNTGSTPVVVRLKYSEEWTDKEGSEIPGYKSIANLFEENETNIYEGVIKDFGEGVDNSADPFFAEVTDKSRIQSGNSWVYYEGYYYYLTVLENRGDTTTSWITSITFNPEIGYVGDETLVYEKNEDGSYTKKWISTAGDGAKLLDAQYNLVIDVETVQAKKSAINELWGIDVASMTAGKVKTFLANLES